MHLPSGLLFRAFDADRLLERARRRGARRFATAWVRGLGDLAYIVSAFAEHVTRRLPGAELSVLVRPGLEEACGWIEALRRVVVVPEWSRQQTLTSPWGLAFPPPWEIGRALRRRGLASAIDTVLPYPLGRWYERDFPDLRPALRWSEAERRVGRALLDEAFPERPRFVVALNTQVGTSAYYDFDKEWGLEPFARLMTGILETIPESRLVLVDAQKADGLPTGPRILDTRGRLSVSQSVSVVANSNVLVALDAGTVNLVYFLRDVKLEIVAVLGRTSCFAPLTWPAPSSRLRLTPVVGRDEDIHAVTPAEVLTAVQAAWRRWRDGATA